jgi:hypothetical protein
MFDARLMAAVLSVGGFLISERELCHFSNETTIFPYLLFLPLRPELWIRIPTYLSSPMPQPPPFLRIIDKTWHRVHHL